jgi:phosphoribosylformylglycinamidine synthase
LFGEDQCRYLITVSEKDIENLIETAEEADIETTVLGTTGGHSLSLNESRISIAEIRTLNEQVLPEYMAL